MNDMEWGGTLGSERPIMADMPPGHAPGKSGNMVGTEAGVFPDELTADEAVRIAVKNLARFARDLERCGDELALQSASAVDPEKLKEAIRAAKSVREATQQVMVERNKVDTVRKDIAGGVGGGSLDLDAARDEIGRRLACLRRAG